MNNKLASIKIFSWEFIWLLFCGFMTIVWVSEVWDVKTAPEKYACLWGGEGPVARLWYYASESLYLLHIVCLIVWFLSGIWLCVCRWSLRACLETSAFIVTRRHVDKKRLCAAAKTREDCQTVPQRSDGQRMGACTSSPAPCFRRRSEAQNRPA